MERLNPLFLFALFASLMFAGCNPTPKEQGNPSVAPNNEGQSDATPKKDGKQNTPVPIYNDVGEL
jgi:hypothetical protein